MQNLSRSRNGTGPRDGGFPGMQHPGYRRDRGGSNDRSRSTPDGVRYRSHNSYRSRPGNSSLGRMKNLGLGRYRGGSRDRSLSRVQDLGQGKRRGGSRD